MGGIIGNRIESLPQDPGAAVFLLCVTHQRLYRATAILPAQPPTATSASRLLTRTGAGSSWVAKRFAREVVRGGASWVGRTVVAAWAAARPRVANVCPCRSSEAVSPQRRPLTAFHLRLPVKTLLRRPHQPPCAPFPRQRHHLPTSKASGAGVHGRQVRCREFVPVANCQKTNRCGEYRTRHSGLIPAAKKRTGASHIACCVRPVSYSAGRVSGIRDDVVPLLNGAHGRCAPGL